MNWTSSAEQQLQEVPFFVRGVVRRGVEKMASDSGKSLVDEAFYAEAKSSRGR